MASAILSSRFSLFRDDEKAFLQVLFNVVSSRGITRWSFRIRWLFSPRPFLGTNINVLDKSNRPSTGWSIGSAQISNWSIRFSKREKSSKKSLLQRFSPFQFHRLRSVCSTFETHLWWNQIASIPSKRANLWFFIFEIRLKLECGWGSDHTHGFHVEIVLGWFFSNNTTPSDRNQYNRCGFSGSGQTDAIVAQVRRLSTSFSLQRNSLFGFRRIITRMNAELVPNVMKTLLL